MGDAGILVFGSNPKLGELNNSDPNKLKSLLTAFVASTIGAVSACTTASILAVSTGAGALCKRPLKASISAAGAPFAIAKAAA